MEINQPTKKTFFLFEYLNNFDFFWLYIKEKTQHPGIRKYSENIGWMFFAKIASMIISFITTTYIARNLGPTNYGQLSYAVSFVGLFGFIAGLGIDQILYRDLIKYPEKRNEYMGSAIGLRMFASIIAIIFCILFAYFLSPKDVSLLLIFIVSLGFIFSSFILIAYEFQAMVDQKYTSLLVVIVILILNILKILVIIYGKGVIYLAFVVLLEPILYAIGYLYLRIKKIGTVRYWKFDKKIALSILKDSFPLIFSSAFFLIYARIDQVMIKNMMDATSVGLYSSAVSISEVWYFIPAIITSGLFPAIINAKKISEELYYKRIKKLFILILFISIITAIPTSFFSKNLLTIIFGTGFVGATTVLQIYVWSNIGGILNSFAQQVLVAENITKTISLMTFLGMIVNVTLNLFWIPRYGMAGAAFASLVSYLIPSLSLILFKQSRRIILSIFFNSALIK